MVRLKPDLVEHAFIPSIQADLTVPSLVYRSSFTTAGNPVSKRERGKKKIRKIKQTVPTSRLSAKHIQSWIKGRQTLRS